MSTTRDRTCRVATIALVLSFLSFFLIAGLAALLLGIDSWLCIRRSGGRLKGHGMAMAAIVLPILMPLFLWVAYAVDQARPLPREMVCGTHLSNLGKAMMVYANDHDDRLPTPSKWCDLLFRHGKIDPNSLQCMGVRKAPDRCLYPLELYLYSQYKHAQGLKGLGACDYAMNPFVEEHGTSSQAGMVVLFETRPGWNQAGGPELLTTDHHEGRGCNILFIGSYVKFIRSEDLDKLKWKPD